MCEGGGEGGEGIECTYVARCTSVLTNHVVQGGEHFEESIPANS